MKKPFGKGQVLLDLVSMKSQSPWLHKDMQYKVDAGAGAKDSTLREDNTRGRTAVCCSSCSSEREKTLKAESLASSKT